MYERRYVFHSIPQSRKHADTDGRAYIRSTGEIDPRGVVRRALRRSKSIARCAYAWLKNMASPPQRISVIMDDALGRVGCWGSRATSIYIFLHGLQSTGVSWAFYVEELMKRDPNAAVFIPTLSDEHKPPDELAKTILESVSTLLTEAPLAPVVVVAYSHGVRIAAHLDLMLRERNRSMLMVSIAGLFYGTRWVDVFNKTWWILGYSNALSGMGFGNEESRMMIRSLRSFGHGCPFRQYTFFVSLSDEKVVPARSGVPCIGAGEEVYVCDNLLHQEVFDKSVSDVVQVCIQYTQHPNFDDDVDEISEE